MRRHSAAAAARHAPYDRCIQAAVFCLLLTLSSGCLAPAAQLQLRVFDASAPTLAQSSDPSTAKAAVFPSGIGGDSSVRLSAALNETAAFCFSVNAPRSLSGVQCAMGLLTSATGVALAAEVQIYRMQTVEIADWPGWHVRSVPPHERQSAPLDVLVPLNAPIGGMPDQIAAGAPLHFWVDVRVPRGAPPGVYTAEVELLSRGQPAGHLPVEITVLPFVLPDNPGPHMIAELDHRALFLHHIRGATGPYAPPLDDWSDDPNRRRLDLVLAHTIAMLRDHGLTPVLPELEPVVRTQADGSIELRWTQYDAIAGPLLNGNADPGSSVPYWLMPIEPAMAVLTATDDVAAARTPAAGYLEQVSGHFAARGWMDRSFALVRGGPGSEAATRLQRLSRALSGEFPFPLITQLCPQDLKPYGWNTYQHHDVYHMVAGWAPPAQFFDMETMAGRRAAGQLTWITVDRPPFSGTTAIHAAPGDTRVLSWQCEALGASGCFLGCVNPWPAAAEQPASPAECARFDARTLLYPGAAFGLREPIPSIRLKYLRDSMQDAGYRALLRANGLEHVVGMMRGGLAGRGGTAAYRTHFSDGRTPSWPRDGRLFDDARQIMARELLDRMISRQPVLGDDVTRGLNWQRFLAATRGFRIAVDGVRVRLGGLEEAGVHVEATLTLDNAGRGRAEGTAMIAPLPDQWVHTPRDEPLSVPPEGSRRARLLARTPGLATDANGTLPLPIRWSPLGDHAVVSTTARLAAIVAGVPRAAPLVDGDLSDWPALSGNVASDFVLISGEGSGTPGSARPLRTTTCFVLHDSEYLYIGVNAQSNVPRLDASARRNQVFYEDMIPMGEELIEILIDPLNGATRSPADLYHIVVKPGGSIITERGIRLEPPCGDSRGWPVRIDIATVVHDDRWTTELRIPLSAFDGGAPQHTVWGFNVTRFDANRQEFSTWSGASPNAYDPMSLGNLILP